MVQELAPKRMMAVLAALAFAIACLLPATALADDLTATELNLPTQTTLETQSIASGRPALNVFGIDVSQWQGAINWKSASSSVKFAILRCGWGSDFRSQDDRYWLANVKGCQENNIPFGVYLYSYATNTTMARSEAQHVIRCLQEAGLSPSTVAFPIYLDIEDESQKPMTPLEFSAVYNTFKSTMNAAGWGKVGIYSSSSWWEGNLSKISIDAKYRWVAHWGVSAPGVGFPNTYAEGCEVWQYGNAVNVPGIAGEVDGDYVRSDCDFLGYPNLFRMYNPNSGEHFYTEAARERDHLTSVGWKYEGVAMMTMKSGGIPVYRLYNPNAGDHHYTTDAKERDRLVPQGWIYEGVAWNSAKSGSPVYRLYNPNAEVGAHHYTLSINERDQLVKYGWKYEGVEMYSAS